MKRPFGGEAPLDQKKQHYAMVHSGRAALRLLVLSGLKGKKFLIPNFLCGVIVDVLRQYSVSYDFYSVKEDLTPDWSTIRGQAFDVLYVINYFGQITQVPVLFKKKTLIIDDVFSCILREPKGALKWATFNSLRKTTALPEGSFLLANFPLALRSIDTKPAVFVSMKYEAKQAKADYLKKLRGPQGPYVNALKKAEELLDGDQKIHAPSQKTLGLLANVLSQEEKEQSIRQKQYRLLDKKLRRLSVKLKPQTYSFYVLNLNRRDQIKANLAKQGIFLPAHWPASYGLDHPLYQRALSIPLSSRFSQKHLDEVAGAVKKQLEG